MCRGVFRCPLKISVCVCVVFVARLRPRHRRWRARVRRPVSGRDFGQRCEVTSQRSRSSIRFHFQHSDPVSAQNCRAATCKTSLGLGSRFSLCFQATSGWKPSSGCLTAKKPSFKAQVAPAEPLQHDCVLHTVNST